MNKKRGISPVIATVLLVVMVIIIGLIIFLWMRGWIGDSIIKFGENIDLVCKDTEFDSTYSNDILVILNTGNVPLYSLKIEFSEEGISQTKSIRDLSTSWPINGLNPGGTFSSSIDILSASKIVVIPVLLGTSDKGDKTYVCEGNGKEIIVQ